MNHCRIIALFFLISILGCELPNYTLPPGWDLPTTPPTSVPPRPPTGGYAYIFQPWYQVNQPKVVSVVFAHGAVYSSYANVYHGVNKSVIYQNAAPLYQETNSILALWLSHKNGLYATGDHASHVLKLVNGAFKPTTRTAGRWSVVGHEGFAAFNNTYTSVDVGQGYSKAMIRDNCVLIDAETGATLGTLPAQAMAQDFIRFQGRLHVSANFGEEVLLIEKQPGSFTFNKQPSPALTLTEFNGELWGAGGMKAGPAQYRQPDGKIYLYRGGRWTIAFDTGSYSVPDTIRMAHATLFLCVDPDQIIELSHDGSTYTFRQVFRRGNDAGQRDRSFGAAGAISPDGQHLYVAFSDKNNTSIMYHGVVGWIPPQKPSQPPVIQPPDTPGDPTPVHDNSKTFTFSPMRQGSFTIDTRGIKHQNGRNRDGGWEYIFLSFFGDGFRRVLLFHAGGGNRAIRYFVEPPGTHKLEVASDNLPGWHTWKVAWGNGKLRFFLDGRQIGSTESFNGRPTKVIAGGYSNSKRNFNGQWRNLRIQR